MTDPNPSLATRALEALTAIGGVAVVALLLWQIIVVALRYVFSLGWPWATDLLTYLNFFIVSLPMIGVVAFNKGVRVDVLRAGMSAGRKALLDRLALLGFFLPAMLWAAWTSWPLTRNSWSLLEGSPNMGGLPGLFVLKTILTAVFVGLALVALRIGLRRGVYGEEGGDA